MKLLRLEHELNELIFDQTTAIAKIANGIKVAKRGRRNRNAPVAFMCLGPSGVGKTETWKQVARLLGLDLLRFDMSEYMEKHAVAKLIGAPPGYEGFDAGGILTNSMRKNPRRVCLFDEIGEGPSRRVRRIHAGAVGWPPDGQSGKDGGFQQRLYRLHDQYRPVALPRHQPVRRAGRGTGHRGAEEDLSGPSSSTASPAGRTSCATNGSASAPSRRSSPARSSRSTRTTASRGSPSMSRRRTSRRSARPSTTRRAARAACRATCRPTSSRSSSTA